MKRFFVTALAAVCLVPFLAPDLRGEVGVKAGLSLAKYQWTDPTSSIPWGYLPFVTGGLTIEAGRGVLSIQPGLFFARMGGRYAVEGDSLEFQYDYLQLPLLLKMNVLPEGSVCPFFGFGGYGAYLLKARGVLVVGGVREAADVTEEYERFDAGLIFGGGFDFHFARMTLSLECRYTFGLMQVLKSPFAGESMKHRAIQALVGLGF
ncbi:MAG TPA: porin family protein [Acidobacteriota bacterium]|nr:porin family protein [Acidobacteriota bacterium]